MCHLKCYIQIENLYSILLAYKHFIHLKYCELFLFVGIVFESITNCKYLIVMLLIFIGIYFEN
jgi:hypothetical protein